MAWSEVARGRKESYTKGVTRAGFVRQDFWREQRRKEVERMDLKPGMAVFRRTKIENWVSDTVKEITSDWFVICEGYKTPLRPSWIKLIENPTEKEAAT